MTVAPCTINGCEQPHLHLSLCGHHYRRWYRSQPVTDEMRAAALPRYWRFVDTSAGLGGCWPWTGSRNQKGYGFFAVRGQQYTASRYGFEQRVGPVGDLQVLHHCDSPPCQNDRHWWLGTNLDNVADRVAKGRTRGPRGVDHPRAVFTEQDIREIRAVEPYMKHRDLGALYGVPHATIGAIARRFTWKHVI